MKKGFILSISIIVLILFLNGCQKNENSGPKIDKSQNADLIIKDAAGDKVNLKMKPKTGDILNYKLHIEQNGSESSTLNKGNEIKNYQTMDLYFLNEVMEVNDAGIITYKVRYDSIMVNIGASDKDTSYSLIYNSNIKDSVYKKSDFVTFNALIGNDFRVRVSSLGEVSTIYDLEKIQNIIYKEYGDTLEADEKEIVKKSLEDQLKELIQTQYQIFPDKEMKKDSTWTSVQQSVLGSFPVENILNYTITSIEEKEGSNIIGLTAALDFKILENTYKEKTTGITYKLDEIKGSGSGKIQFNITRGCIVFKETEKNLSAKIQASLKGQSATSSKTDVIKLKLELL
jgi:hypothetical protein